MKVNLRGVDLNLLTIFEAIWEERQMSRAATRLGMSQPAVSQALGRLRLQFKDELFIRSRQGMKPTPRAAALASDVRDALGSVRAALTPSDSFDPDERAREFTIAFARYGELTLFPLLLDALAPHAATLKVRSHPADRADVFDLLRDNEADVGFDYREPADDSLHSCLFERENMVVIARRDHPRLGDTFTAQDYFRESHVVLAVTEEQRVFYESVFSAGDERRTIAAEAQQAVAIPALVGFLYFRNQISRWENYLRSSVAHAVTQWRSAGVEVE